MSKSINIEELLQTSMLQHIDGFLKGKNLAVLVDLVTVRICSLFAFGKFGDFHQLLYHPDSREHKPGVMPDGYSSSGKWSIYPFVLKNGEEFSTLKGHNGCKQHFLDTVGQKLSLKSIGCTSDNSTFDWEIAVNNDSVAFELSTSDKGQVGIEFNLYPLFSHYIIDGVASKIDYEGKIVNNFENVQRLILMDDLKRVPKFQIETTNCKIALSSYSVKCSGHYLMESNDTVASNLGLSIKVLSPKQEMKMSFRLVANEKPTRIPLNEISDLSKKVIRMGDALCRMQQETASEFPSLRGLICSKINTETLKPALAVSYAVPSYLPRLVMIWAAASLASGDQKYIDAAFESLVSYLNKCPAVGRRGIHVVGALTNEGLPKDITYQSDGTIKNCYYNRPSNFTIMIRGLLYCHKVYTYFSDGQKSRQALDLGVEVLKGLESYFGYGINYVNNFHYPLVCFLKRLEEKEHYGAALIRQYIERDFESRGCEQNYLKPIKRAFAGAHESQVNTEQDLASIASECLSLWMLREKDCYANAVLDLNKCMMLIHRFFPDEPSLYGASIAEPLEKYVGGYNNVICHGGMWDLCSMEMLIAAAEYLKDDFSAKSADLIAISRLAWSYKENGIMFGICQHTPGLSYKNTTYSEVTNNYGAIGLYAYWKFCKHLNLAY